MKKIDSKRILFSGILALISTFFLLSGFLGQSSFVLRHGLFTWGLIFLISAFLFYCTFKTPIRKRDLFIATAAIIFSACQVIGFVFVRQGMMTLSKFSFCLSLFESILGLFLISFAGLKYFYLWINKPQIRSNRFERKMDSFLGELGGKIYWIFFGVLLISWIPMYLSCYPGLCAYDGPAGVYHILAEHELRNNIPIVWNLYLTGSFYLGHLLLGSYEAGLAIYSILTGIIVISILAYVCYRMIGWQVPKIFIILSLLFFAWNPVIIIHVFTTTKEALFGAFLLLLMALSVDLLMNIEAFFKSKFQVIRYVVVAILMCLMRLQGIYMLIFFTPFVVVACKRYRVKAFLVLFVSIAFVWAFNGPFLSSLGVIPGESREMLSVPMQQVARVMNTRPEKVTEEEKELIYKVIPKEHIADYEPEVADPIKSYFNYNEFKNNLMTYIKLYLKLGIRDPRAYLESFLYGSVGCVYLGNTSFNDSMLVWTAFPIYFPPDNQAEKFLSIDTKNLFPAYAEYREKIQTGKYLQSMPLISILVSNGLPFAAMVFAAGYLFFKRRKRWAVPIILSFGYWGTLLLGPVILIRYTLCIMIAVPFIFSLCFMKNKDESISSVRIHKPIKGSFEESEKDLSFEV